MKKLIAVILIVNTLSLYSQDIDLKIGEYFYPNPSKVNFIKWLDLTTIEWEAEMKKFDFSDRGLDDGCVYYSSGISLDEGLFGIFKCPGNFMKVIWSDRLQKGITKLDALINELEPYYEKTNERGKAIYVFKHGDFAYQFTVHRDRSFEFALVKKYNLQK